MKTPRVAAMDYLARREHTRVELQRKLALKGYEAAEIEAALDRLVEQGLVSDRRFAEAFAEYRAHNGRGPLKIKQELKQHGVSDTIIAEVMASLAVDWRALAHQVWLKKFGEQPQTLKEKARQQRFMQQRGFSYEEVADEVESH